MTTSTMHRAWCRKELAHAMLHAPRNETTPEDGAIGEPDEEGRSLHRGIWEVEADSVAYMVATAHGLDLTTSSVPYVSGWAVTVPGSDPVQAVQDTAKRVRDTALTILDRLDTHQIPDGTPPGLDRAAPQATAPTTPGPGAPSGKKTVVPDDGLDRRSWPVATTTGRTSRARRTGSDDERHPGPDRRRL